METTKHILHTAKINNNCPECFANKGLEFTFSQKEKENKFYSQASKEIEEVLYCHNCQQTIYPVNWTDDIERVYAYQRKLAKPISTMIKVKPLLYGIIFFDAIVLAAIIYYLNS